MSERLRTFVCEDDHRLRAHLCRLLERDPDIDLIGNAASAEDALAQHTEGAWDVLLLDLELPGMDGLSLVGKLPGPPAGPEVLILTTFAKAEKVLSAMRKMFGGHVEKPG